VRLLIIDHDDVGLALALRASEAGHEVRIFVKPKHQKNKTGNGFKGIEQIDNWVSSMAWADLIFPTSNDEYMERLDAFRDKNYPVFGPSKASSDLEIKRVKGMQFLEEHGIKCPPYEQFKTLQEAEKFVWKNGGRWVFKTLGDNEDKSLSYCSKSPADMISRLRRWADLGMNPKGPVMLQEFIDGIEMGVSRWMGSKGWIGLPNENFEHKPLMPSNCGPNTGEMGTVMKYEKQSLFYENLLDSLGPDLLKIGHLGDIDITAIIDEKGNAWPLEFTCRPGWPAFNIMLSEHKGDPIQWMFDALNGEDTLQVSEEIAVGIVLAHPMFPYDTPVDEGSNVPVYGVTKKNVKYIQPQGIKMAKMPDMEGERIVERAIWATSGNYIAVVTGMGKSVKQASERAYRTVKEINISNKIYRDDIGEALEEELPRLQKHGYAKGFVYA
jgi:phosphoribosylamine---glycine ligase